MREAWLCCVIGAALASGCSPGERSRPPLGATETSTLERKALSRGERAKEEVAGEHKDSCERDDDNQPSCAAPLTLCGTACLDLQTSHDHCGTCNVACGCSQACVGGACASQCSAGTTDCGGTCASLTTDGLNCGACGTICAAGTACAGGSCAPVCAVASTRCATGCSDLQTDSGNCGACGQACLAGQSCASGRCSCPAGQTECSGSCVDLGTAAAHCGACGTVCGTGQSCVSGACTCGSGLSLCNGACVDVLSDPANCGGCGRLCAPPNASGLCTLGTCAITACSAGHYDCDGNPLNGCESTAACNGPRCGNGIIDPGEICDDANVVNLDGCSAACQFEQNLRINNLQLDFGLATCPSNRFGGAIGGIAQSSLQAGFANSIATGTTSVMFVLQRLTDYTGANEPALPVGVVNGTPFAGTGYDGTSDLDWWYLASVSDVDAARVPLSSLPGSISAGHLVAGPGSARLVLPFGSLSPMSFFGASLSVQLGATVPVHISSTNSPPGHLPSERLPPGFATFATAGQPTSPGSFCGAMRTSSLAATAVPPSLLSGGSAACAENYASTNSFLDVLVNGCHVLGFITTITRSQPDSVDSALPALGAGPPYLLSASNAASKIVDTCRDRLGATIDLAGCLQRAGYSSAFSFTADRVDIRP